MRKRNFPFRTARLPEKPHKPYRQLSVPDHGRPVGERSTKNINHTNNTGRNPGASSPIMVIAITLAALIEGVALISIFVK